MSQIQQIVQLAERALHGDSAERDSAKATLVALRSRPNELLMAFMTILEGPSKLEHRKFVCEEFRSCFSKQQLILSSNLWNNCSPENQALIKKKFYQILFKETDQQIKNCITNTLGELAEFAITEHNEQWSNFQDSTWQLMKKTDLQSMLAGFKNIGNIAPFSMKFTDPENKLPHYFQNGLRSENTSLQLSALKAFSSYFQILSESEEQSKKFSFLLQDICRAVYQILVNDEGNIDGLNILSKIFYMDCGFFKKDLRQLYELMQSIFKTQGLRKDTRRIAVQILGDYSIQYPRLFRKNEQMLKDYLEMIFTFMVEIDSEISEDWQKPKGGYRSYGPNGDENLKTTKIGMFAIDKFISSVGSQKGLPMLWQIMQRLLAQDDWRYHYSVVMALSQVGEYIEDVSHIDSIVGMIGGHLENPNPMLRYAACEAIGQISDNMRPHFQGFYGDALYPKLVALLNDQVPRVVSHAAACLTNFLEDMKLEKAENLIEMMMELLLKNIKNGISLVKESCVTTISSVVELCDEKFERYLSKTMSLLIDIFKTEIEEQYRQLRCQAILTMTNIASTLDREKFRPYLNTLMNIMMIIQNTRFQEDKPQKAHILKGWANLFSTYGRELTSELTEILPSLLAFVKRVILTDIAKFQNQETKEALKMLNLIMNQLKELYHPYVSQTDKLISSILKIDMNDKVAHQLSQLLPNIVSCINCYDLNRAMDMAKLYMKNLFEMIEQESQTDIICCLLKGLKKLINEFSFPFLHQLEIQVLSDKMLEMFHASEKKKLQASKIISKKNSQQIDEEDYENSIKKIKQQQKVQLAISDVIRAMFKSHPDLSVKFSQHLITKIIPGILDRGGSDSSCKFAIHLISNMVKFLGCNLLFQYWEYLGEILLRFCGDTSCEVRQIACHGLGKYAQGFPLSVSDNTVISHWLSALENVANRHKGSETEKQFRRCQQQAISSIGKIVDTHSHIFNPTHALHFWINHLPLKYEKEQAVVQHLILVNILLKEPQKLIRGTDEAQIDCFTRVVKIFGQILSEPSAYDDKIEDRMKQFLMKMSQVELFARKETEIWEALSELEKLNIKDLVQS